MIHFFKYRGLRQTFQVFGLPSLSDSLPGHLIKLTSMGLSVELCSSLHPSVRMVQPLSLSYSFGLRCSDIRILSILRCRLVNNPQWTKLLNYQHVLLWLIQEFKQYNKSKFNCISAQFLKNIHCHLEVLLINCNCNSIICN